MKKTIVCWLVGLGILISFAGQAQVNEDKLGAWYMYFFTNQFENSKFGIQGDVQFRNWNLAGDLEQLLLRGGITWKPVKKSPMFTLGYANITTGVFGASSSTFKESRIYQEVFYPHRMGTRLYLVHRFRYEQRFVEAQDFRTRYRYNFFVNVPLNREKLEKNAAYIALYNELFLNGQRDIGDGRRVEIFDRNRLYLGFGYGLRDNLRLQLGWMQQTTDPWMKKQVQVSLHHAW